MNTSMQKRSIVALLVAGSIVAAAPVAAQAYGPLYEGPQAVSDAQAVGKAESSDLVLRRDGTKATAFATGLGPEATASADGFDWGDGAIGAAAGLLIAALAVGGSAAIRGGQAPAPAATPASQSV